MSNTIGVICEYNPFHKGHKYQIDKIREENPDSTIVIIMSGNIVQRGELAMIDKGTRAELAVISGADLVVELPYPYCASVAEIFARAGVEIAVSLSCDTLYFGTEECDVDYLTEVANKIASSEFEEELKKELSNRSESYLSSKTNALKRMGVDIPKLSNDMLALEYIRAINEINAQITPKSIKRVGAGYSDEGENEIMSASGIRRYFYKNKRFTSVPGELIDRYNELSSTGKVLSLQQAKEFLYRLCLITPREKFDSAFDTPTELGAFIKDASQRALNADDFFSSLNSKVYTSARIKRTIFYTLFGVKQFSKSPEFTVLLSANKRGTEHLKRIKTLSSITIITKLSDGKSLGQEAREQLKTLFEIDKLYFTFFEGNIINSPYDRRPIII